jgi:hypothetical protein
MGEVMSQDIGAKNNGVEFSQKSLKRLGRLYSGREVTTEASLCSSLCFKMFEVWVFGYLGQKRT